MAFSSGQAEINVTPMIDVLLVLIIVFMVIVPVTPKGVVADIPREATKSEPTQPRTVVIELHASATGPAALSINREPVTWDDLRVKLIDIYKTRAERVAFVRADSDMEFEPVAQVIDIVHSAGVENVGLMK
jgi:biopolymer transport protein TolR